MLSLGPGIGPNRLGLSGKPLPKWLTDAGCTFAINVDRQVKALANPNSPFINPLVDVVGKLGKNLFDPTLVKQGVLQVDGIVLGSATRVYQLGIKVNPSTEYTVKSANNRVRVINEYGSNGQFLRNLFPNPEQTRTFTTSADCFFIGVSFNKPTDTDNITPLDIINDQIQLNEGLPITYEPYGFNNVLLQSFAGTTADGYTQIALPNGKNPWFLKFDGTDSLGIMANTADVDILGTNDFAISTVFRTPATLINGYILSKGLDSVTQQYQIFLYADGKLEVATNNGGTIVSSIGAVQPNTLYEFLHYRTGGRLRAKLQKVEIYNQANSASLVSLPNLRIGARSTNAGGTTHVSFFNGNLGNLAIFYNGSNGLDIAKVEKAVAKLNANYI